MPRCRPCRPLARVVITTHPGLPLGARRRHRTTGPRRAAGGDTARVRRSGASARDGGLIWRISCWLLHTTKNVNTAVVSASPFPPPKKKQGNVHSGTNYLSGGSRARSSGSAQHAERGTQARLVTVAVGVVALSSPPGWLTYSQLLHGHCVPLRKTHTCSITKTQRFFWSGK